MQSKMMAYDRVVTEFNTSRLKGTSYPIIHSLIDTSLSLSASDVRDFLLFPFRLT
jgi:nuclear pore complex protein Nup93